MPLVVCLNIESIRQFISRITDTQIFSPELYFLSQLPARMNFRETAMVIAFVLLGVMLLAGAVVLRKQMA